MGTEKPYRINVTQPNFQQLEACLNDCEALTSKQCSDCPVMNECLKWWDNRVCAQQSGRYLDDISFSRLECFMGEFVKFTRLVQRYQEKIESRVERR